MKHWSALDGAEELSLGVDNDIDYRYRSSELVCMFRNFRLLTFGPELLTTFTFKLR